MKRILTLLCVILISSVTIKAQENFIDPPRVYFGLGSGINAFTGIFGIAANVRVINNAFIEGGLGLGGWGYKYSIGARYDFRQKNTFGLGINYTGATGLDNLEMDMEVYDGSTQRVNIDCLRAGTVDVKGRFSITAGKKNRLYIDLGYAIPLKDRVWKIKNGVVLSDVSEKALDWTQPGGFMVGLGFMFGLSDTMK